MSVPTLYRLAEETLKMISGGDIQSASNISLNEVKIAIAQVANSLLKVEHIQVNEKMAEKIPNGTVIGTYEGIVYTSSTTGRSIADLPIKPIKLPRNMGVWSVYLSSKPENEFIPLQMGQMNLIASQPLVNDLLGQIGYENRGMKLYFNKDLKLLFPNDTITLELAIMDISQYDDYSPLPILPEQEWQIKMEVFKAFSQVGVSDYLVDATTKQQQNVPLKDQQQT